jgi:hypothetical protein
MKKAIRSIPDCLLVFLDGITQIRCRGQETGTERDTDRAVFHPVFLPVRLFLLQRCPTVLWKDPQEGFSGGPQLWVAPVKIIGGALLTAAICLPSLYVLACLGGANDTLRLGPLAGLLLATIALNATLLVSFAPIAWVFSQSTDSIAFISCLHLVLWSVGFYFGLRLVVIGARFFGVVDRAYLLLGS